MLSPDDRALAARDAALPELLTLLDPDRFREALVEAFPRLTVGTITGHYLRYKPGTSCLAGYWAQIGDHPVELHAVTARDPVKLRLRLQDRVEGTAFGRAGVRLGDRAITVRAFPNDARLKAIGRLADPSRRRRLLPEALAEGRLERVGYKPERRFVGRLETAAGALVVKLHAENRFQSALQGAIAFQPTDEVVVAPLVHHDRSAGLVVQAWMSGDLLALRQADPGWRPDGARTVGTAVAALHAQRPAVLDGSTGADQSLTELGETLGHLLPALAGPIRTHAATLFGALQEMAEPSGPIHGDFYSKQVLIDGARAVILDCDQARIGDPAEDLGTFRAHLLRDVLRRRIDPDRAEAVWEAFRSGYRRADGDFELRVQLFVAIGCLRLAPDPFRHREPSWTGETESLIQLSVAALAPLLGLAPSGSCQ